MIFLTINNEALDVQCGSTECVQLKILYIFCYPYIIIWYEINDSVKFFFYIYIITMYQYFSDFGRGNNTNIDKAERGTLSLTM